MTERHTSGIYRNWFGKLRPILNLVLMIFLPKHIKRMMFLVTIQMRLANENVLRNSSLERLNAKLNVATNINVLKVAQTIGTKIDMDERIIHDFARDNQQPGVVCVTDQGFADSAKLLVSGSPPWMNYGNRSMVNDLKTLVQPCRAEIRT